MSANLSRTNFNRRNIFFLQNKLCKAAVSAWVVRVYGG